MFRGSSVHVASDTVISLFFWKPSLQGVFPLSLEPPDRSASEDYREDSPLHTEKPTEMKLKQKQSELK